MSIAFAGLYKEAHADITSNLYNHWACDEGSGTFCFDSGSEGLREELRGSTIPTWIAGFIGTGAVNFNGSTAYMNTANFGPSTPGTPFTISAWVRPQSGMAGYNRIMETGFSTNYYLGTNSNATQYQCIIKDPSVNNWAVGGTLAVGVWTLVTCTFDGTNGTLYVNQTQVAQHTFSDPGTLSNIVNVGSNTSINGGWWKGGIDDIRIYKRALSASDVTELYHLGYPAATGGKLDRLILWAQTFINGQMFIW